MIRFGYTRNDANILLRLAKWTKHGDFSKSTRSPRGITKFVEYRSQVETDLIRSVTLMHHDSGCFGLILRSEDISYYRLIRSLNIAGIRTSNDVTHPNNTLLFTSDYSEVYALLSILERADSFQPSIGVILSELKCAVTDLIMWARPSFLLSDPLKGMYHERAFLDYTPPRIATTPNLNEGSDDNDIRHYDEDLSPRTTATTGQSRPISLMDHWIKIGDYSEQTRILSGITNSVKYKNRFSFSLIKSIALMHHSDEYFGLIIKSSPGYFTILMRDLEEWRARIPAHSIHQNIILLFTFTYAETPDLLRFLDDLSKIERSVTEFTPALNRIITEKMSRERRPLSQGRWLGGGTEDTLYRDFLGLGDDLWNGLFQNLSREVVGTNSVAQQQARPTLFQPSRDTYSQDLERAIRASLEESTTIDTVADAKASDGEIPNHMICPISQEIMTVPAYFEGLAIKTCFEYSFIKGYLDVAGTDARHPITRESLVGRKLVVNEALKKECADFVAKATAPVEPPAQPKSTVIEVKRKRGCCTIA